MHTCCNTQISLASSYDYHPVLFGCARGQGVRAELPGNFQPVLVAFYEAGFIESAARFGSVGTYSRAPGESLCPFVPERAVFTFKEKHHRPSS